MILEPLIIQDKNGVDFTLRTPNADEAQCILDIMAEVAASSPYILSTPESFRARTLDSQIKWLADAEKSDVAIIIGIYDKQSKLVGLCNGSSYGDLKRKHRAALGVSLHPDFRGRGLGKIMMEILVSKMKTFTGIQIIELDVMVNNRTAVKLYESLGFVKAGVFPRAFLLPSGEVSDNLKMFLDVK